MSWRADEASPEHIMKSIMVLVSRYHLGGCGHHITLISCENQPINHNPPPHITAVQFITPEVLKGSIADAHDSEKDLRFN